MKKIEFLEDYIKVTELHAIKLDYALKSLNPAILPLTAKKLENIDGVQSAFMDMVATRFSKLQDGIGKKIFPLVLEALKEDDKTFIDKLNKLEKIEYLHDANWWTDLREMRNELTHDYPDDYELIAKNFNKLIPMAGELLEYWQVLKEKLNLLIKTTSR